jgi:hypothetical protein
MAKTVRFIFTQENYYLILTSIGLLILGFILMTGKDNAGTAHFNEDIYSFRRITLAPIIILTGYALMIYAIMSKPVHKNKKQNGQS